MAASSDVSPSPLSVSPLSGAVVPSSAGYASSTPPTEGGGSVGSILDSLALSSPGSEDGTQSPQVDCGTGYMRAGKITDDTYVSPYVSIAESTLGVGVYNKEDYEALLEGASRPAPRF